MRAAVRAALCVLLADAVLALLAAGGADALAPWRPARAALYGALACWAAAVYAAYFVLSPVIAVAG